MTKQILSNFALCVAAATMAAALPQSTPASPLSPASNLPTGWSYMGCYADLVEQRSFLGAYYPDGSMTGAACVAFCHSKGYPVAGTEYSSQCFCGADSNGLIATPDECTMSCGGNSSEACGGPDRITVYTNGKTGPQTDIGDGSTFLYMGCYNDTMDNRALPYFVEVPGGSSKMSVASCANACRDNGFDHAGVEYGGECWCGNDGVEGGSQIIYGIPSVTGCDVPCIGNNTEYCGGDDRLNVYYLPPMADTTSATASSATTSA